MEGKGTYYYSESNAYYEGNWLNGQKHGYGLYYSEEEIYEGEWQRG